MRQKLKHFRVAEGLTQAQVAAAVGVSQPNYHRWESGMAPIPDDQLKKLATALKATPEQLLGKHAPIEAEIYNPNAGDQLNYWGEMAIHFRGGGGPLMLTISVAQFNRVHSNLQNTDGFIAVESLANQTVAIRREAIADVYLSEEACDHFGVEGVDYPQHYSEVQLPDPRDWEIIESLHCDGVGIEDYEDAHVERVQSMLYLPDEKLDALVADGHIKPDDVEAERAEIRRRADWMTSLATDVTYQLSTGVQRKFSVVGMQEEDLYNAVYELTEDFYHESLEMDDMIRLDNEDQVAFINKNGLDYISIPTHKLQEGETDANAELLDSYVEPQPTNGGGKGKGRGRRPGLTAVEKTAPAEREKLEERGPR